MQNENCVGEFKVYHCIIHQETLHGKALKMEHVVNTGAQTVHFIRTRGLNYRQFDAGFSCGSMTSFTTPGCAG